MTMKALEGRCLCGAVKVRVPTGDPEGEVHVDVCHCNMCRKWSGGPMMVIDCSNDVQFEGEESISVYQSSDWAERGFCKKCGTNLFYRLRDNSFCAVLADLFDQDDRKLLAKQVFIDEKPTYYSFSNETQNFTGEELFAQFAPPNE